MNEKLDAILSEYEEIWRAAAMNGTPQFCRNERRNQTLGFCAASIALPALRRDMEQQLVEWTCPECGAHTTWVIGVAIHLNDEHEWPWDMFAGKFRDALERGTIR